MFPTRKEKLTNRKNTNIVSKQQPLTKANNTWRLWNIRRGSDSWAWMTYGRQTNNKTLSLSLSHTRLRRYKEQTLNNSRNRRTKPFLKYALRAETCKCLILSADRYSQDFHHVWVDLWCGQSSSANRLSWIPRADLITHTAQQTLFTSQQQADFKECNDKRLIS